MSDAPLIAFDFDGVLHMHDGSDDPIPSGEPVVGALGTVRWLAAQGYRMCVFSCRSQKPGGIEAMQGWLRHYGFGEIPISQTKPEAALYIDDRGFRFDGPKSWPVLVDYLQRHPSPSRWQKEEGQDTPGAASRPLIDPSHQGTPDPA